MTQRSAIHPGAAQQIGSELQRIGAESILLVTGRASWERSGAAARLRDCLAGYQVTRLCEFDVNPKLPQVEQELLRLRKVPYDAVVAVGGGSVIDVAKLIAFFASQPGPPKLNDDQPVPRRVPLFALPTTAGSGSEATSFAVVYSEGRKYSVAHPSILPDVALVDAELTLQLPPRLTAVSGMDALAQAMESMWSVNSTAESRTLASGAIERILNHLVASVQQPTSDSRAAMAEAAYMAGQAINISRTTAPHAISYALTSGFAVPHGHAVALTLGQLLLFNAGVSAEDVIDPRGPAHVHTAIEELNRYFGCRDAGETCDRIRSLMEQIGLETSLQQCGVHTEEQRRWLAESVNTERLANNPRRLSATQLRDILRNVA